jgi:hypothetical protein
MGFVACVRLIAIEAGAGEPVFGQGGGKLSRFWQIL